jgi:hypothetical protein
MGYDVVCVKFLIVSILVVSFFLLSIYDIFAILNFHGLLVKILCVHVLI